MKAGILTPESIVGHGVKLSDAEIEILKKSGAALVTNPESNMNNAVGIPRIIKMLKEGILVGPL